MCGSKQDKLYLSNLESYQDFLRNPKNLGEKRGVYIWGFRFFDPLKEFTTEFIPYYVGKHRTDIHRRIQEHVFGLREGTHKILFSYLLRVPGKYRSQEVEDHAFLNVGNKENKKRNKNSLSAAERVELIPHVNSYIDNLYITYIDVSGLGFGKEDEKQYIDNLERFVQDKIGTERLSSRLGIKYPVTFCPEIISSEGTESLFDIKSTEQKCLEQHASAIKRVSNCATSTLYSMPHNAVVHICGVVTVLREMATKKGPHMGFATAEDMTGSFEVVIFPDAYAKYADLLRSEGALLFKGNVVNADKGMIACNEVIPLDKN